MPRLFSSSSVLGTVLSLSAVACGDGPTADTPTITPQALQIVSGDKQTAISGGAVAAPLRVRVIGSDTRPMHNATVKWSVAEGLATLTPVESTTDASGETETQATIKSVTGLVRVNATVKELDPITFSLTAGHVRRSHLARRPGHGCAGATRLRPSRRTIPRFLPVHAGRTAGCSHVGPISGL